MKESDCKVTDCSSHVQHVPTKCDGKVVKDTVTPDAEMGKVTCGDEGHHVEHVTANHKNLRRHEIFLRNTRVKLRVKIGVQITAATDTMSTTAELTDESRRLMSSITA